MAIQSEWARQPVEWAGLPVSPTLPSRFKSLLNAPRTGGMCKNRCTKHRRMSKTDESEILNTRIITKIWNLIAYTAKQPKKQFSKKAGTLPYLWERDLNANTQINKLRFI